MNSGIETFDEANNMCSIQLEFYVNDLSRRNASTFVQLGELDFARDEIRFCPSRVPTDGLLIKGRYSAITLAVYGNTTTLNAELTPPPTQQQSTALNRNGQFVLISVRVYRF